MKQNSYYDQYPTLLHYLNTHQIESLPADWRRLQRIGHHCSAVGAHPATQEQHCGKLLCIQQLSCIMCCGGASRKSAALCAVGAHPENHLPRWVPPHALLARGSVDGATNLCPPSTLLKVNYQVMRYLYFVSVEGDLQERHFTLPNANSPSARAQKCGFCARKARKWGFQRQKAHKNPDSVCTRG